MKVAMCMLAACGLVVAGCAAELGEDEAASSSEEIRPTVAAMPIKLLICSNGRHDSRELGVDCGGPCRPCFCAPGGTADCYDGASGTEGVGICAAGTKTCNSAGSAFGGCEGQVLPSAADDCWTRSDESCGLDATCASDTNPTVEVSAGGATACARTDAGQVHCWGRNSSGMIGDGTTTNRATPTLVPGIADAISLSVGSGHSCAVRSSGRVLCWGDNRYGQLGDSTTASRTSPVEVSTLTDAVSVSAGMSHTCAIRASGTIACWGYNHDYQLGDETTADRYSPVDLHSSTTWQSVSAGSWTTCGVTSAGVTMCWGAIPVGNQQSDSNTWSERIKYAMQPQAAFSNPWDLHSLHSVDVGFPATCAIDDLDRAVCWGWNETGGGYEFGGGAYYYDRDYAAVVSHGSDVVGISTGAEASCAVYASGRVVCWGAPANGLGDGTDGWSSTGVTVVGIADARMVSAGSDSFCAAMHTGRVACWGRNSYGQLGDGTTTDRLTPVEVAFP